MKAFVIVKLCRPISIRFFRFTNCAIADFKIKNLTINEAAGSYNILAQMFKNVGHYTSFTASSPAIDLWLLLTDIRRYIKIASVAFGRLSHSAVDRNRPQKASAPFDMLR